VSPAITALECSKPELTKRIHLPRGHLALLLGVGTAVPELRWNQDHIAELLAERWKLAGSSLDRWKRIIAGSGIDFRHGVIPPDEAMNLTTAQRMSLYEKHAGTLAEVAARQAMKSAGVEVEQITDLVVVSCTGLAAPGLDVDLVVRLNLNRNVRRTVVGFMGCFGAISGLRTAAGACAVVLAFPTRSSTLLERTAL
jgi:predicted naringenin-chalcone synthase